MAVGREPCKDVTSDKDLGGGHFRMDRVEEEEKGGRKGLLKRSQGKDLPVRVVAESPRGPGKPWQSGVHIDQVGSVSNSGKGRRNRN